MSVHVEFNDGPLSATPPPWVHPGAGAVITFEGVVRPTEDGTAIDALDYDAYRPMADDMLADLASEVARMHGLTAVSVEHSVGRIGAGETSFRLRIASPHRAEGLAAAGEFISKMKEAVPIFKTAVWSEVRQQA